MFRRWCAAFLALLALSACVPGRAAGVDPVEEILAGMTVEQKVGQMFFVTAPNGAKAAAKDAEKYALGGYVLYAAHFSGRTPKTVSEFTERCQAASAIPMLVGVDEEGGSTTRISRYKAFRKKKFPSPMALIKEGGMEAVLADAREKAELLLSMGINVNLVISFTFALGSALAAAGGVLVGVLFNAVSFNMGLMAGLKAFAAAVLGGIGSVPGAMLGGLLLGVAEVAGVAAGYSSYRDAIAFGILVLVLLVRPTGLLGEKFQRKV